MTYVLAVGGLILLLAGGDILVRGAVRLSEVFQVPKLVIGLTVVAFGTSSPEMVVCLSAVLEGVPEIAIGNVVGSNTANILMVLGLPAIIFPIASNQSSLQRDFLIMFVVSLAFVALCYFGALDWWQGALMLLALISYLCWCYIDARRQGAAALLENAADRAADTVPIKWLRPACFVVGGLIALIIGSHLLVDAATIIARSFGVSDAVIGLTLVAVGTSLPELVTSAVAALKRHGELAIGSVIGSNLFNMLAIMGVTSMVRPIPVPDQFLNFDLWVMLGAAAMLAPFALRNRPIGRVAGVVFLSAYVIYISALFFGLDGGSAAAG